MSHQSFKDESNWKHEPHAKHYVEDKFGKNADTRNWKKNLDETIEEEQAKGSDQLETDSSPTKYGSTDYNRNEDGESMETSTQVERKLINGNSMEQCIRDCITCYQECISCIPHCLAQGGKHAEQKHLILMMECSEMCNLSASMMHLKGQFASEHCQLCAKVCDACAESCSQVDPNDSMMQKCADICRRCAESCRNMAH